MFLLEVLCGLLDFRKCLLIDQRKIFATLWIHCFVEWRVNRNNVSSSIFWYLSLIFGVIKSILSRLLFRASSYSYFAVLNKSSLDKFFNSLFWMEFGICLMTFDGPIALLFIRKISSILHIK